MADGSERRLLISGLVLGFPILACPLVVRWADTVEVNWPLVVLVCAPALPVLGFVVLTLVQQHRGIAMTTFEAGPLVVSAYVMSAWVLAGGLIGYWSLLLAVVVFPVCGVHVALAWVRPTKNRDETLTVGLAILILPFVVWFAGRADEYVIEALVAGAVIAAIVVALALLRRRGRRSLRVRT